MKHHFSLVALTASPTSKQGLTHAVLQSVLNRAQATQNDKARTGNQERGGCWSEAFLNMVGSRDWTLKREKLTPQTISLTKRFYQEALAWLVNEKHVKAIEVDIWKESNERLARSVTLTLLDGSKFEVTV